MVLLIYSSKTSTRNRSQKTSNSLPRLLKPKLPSASIRQSSIFQRISPMKNPSHKNNLSSQKNPLLPLQQLHKDTELFQMDELSLVLNPTLRVKPKNLNLLPFLRAMILLLKTTALKHTTTITTTIKETSSILLESSSKEATLHLKPLLPQSLLLLLKMLLRLSSRTLYLNLQCLKFLLLPLRLLQHILRITTRVILRATPTTHSGLSIPTISILLLPTVLKTKLLSNLNLRLHPQLLSCPLTDQAVSPLLPTQSLSL